MRNEETARRHRMNVGAIITAQTLSLRLPGRHGSGRKIGEAEEWFFEQMTPGDTFVFGGEIWRFMGIEGTNAIVTRAADKEPKVPAGACPNSPCPPSWPAGCGG
ncbi:hypothetical protein [Brevundimonas denitrificans]|uniref:hypothetical protein n=1 Tax=Brevundimonas denitrificans TaxID=1443434 RepID=UPI00352FC7A0